MIVVMKDGTTNEHIDHLSHWLNEHYCIHVNMVVGTGTTVLALDGYTAAVDKDALLRDPKVDRITKV